MAGIGPVGGGIAPASTVRPGEIDAAAPPRITAPSQAHEAAAALNLIQTAIAGAGNSGGIDVTV